MGWASCNRHRTASRSADSSAALVAGLTGGTATCVIVCGRVAYTPLGGPVTGGQCVCV